MTTTTYTQVSQEYTFLAIPLEEKKGFFSSCLVADSFTGALKFDMNLSLLPSSLPPTSHDDGNVGGGGGGEGIYGHFRAVA